MDINIAICDDESEQTEYIKMLVSKWADENNIEINIDMFESAENFKFAWSESKKYDILLLDIQMGGQNGVELARDLRGTDGKLIIVFITALPDFISDGYEVSALHYLIKPISENKLFETLDRAVKKINKPKKTLFIDADGVNFKILLDEIVYIEAFGHLTSVNTTNGKYDIQQNIGQIEKDLSSDFFRCHRSYIVNLKYVRQISKTEIHKAHSVLLIFFFTTGRLTVILRLCLLLEKAGMIRISMVTESMGRGISTEKKLILTNLKSRWGKCMHC